MTMRKPHSNISKSGRSKRAVPVPPTAPKGIKSSGIRKNSSGMSSRKVHDLGTNVIRLETKTRTADYEAVQNVAIFAYQMMRDPVAWANEIKDPVWRKVLRGNRPKPDDYIDAISFLMRLHRNGDARAANIRTHAVKWVWDDGKLAHSVAEELVAHGGYEKIEQARVAEREKLDGHEEAGEDLPLGVVDDGNDDDEQPAMEVSADDTGEKDAPEVGVIGAEHMAERVNGELTVSQGTKPASKKKQANTRVVNLDENLIVYMPNHKNRLGEILKGVDGTFTLKIVNRGKIDGDLVLVECVAVH